MLLVMSFKKLKNCLSKQERDELIERTLIKINCIQLKLFLQLKKEFKLSYKCYTNNKW